MKILIVDDNKENLYLLESLLKGSGYVVVSAKDGIEALDKLRKDSVDMIISDILMPRMDGFQLCRECKKNPHLRKIPFIFYTATYTDKKDEEFALSLGAERFIIKPVDIEIFLKTLKEIFEEHKKGLLIAPQEPIKEEESYLAQYNKRLVQKLEKKMLDLKKVNRAIQESENRIRELFKYMSSGAAVYEAKDNGKDFIIKDFNRAAENIEKVKKEDIIGKSVLKTFPGVKDFGLFKVFQEVYKTGKSQHHPISLYKDQRITGWRENYIYKLPSGEIAVVYDDITERKQAEDTIKRQLAEITSYYENIPIGLAVLDCDLHFLKINDMLAKINGLSAKEHLNKTVKEIVPDLELQALKISAEILRTGEPVKDIELSGETLAEPGVKHVWLEGWYPLKDDSDKITGFSIIVQDITERKQAEEELRLHATIMHNVAEGICLIGLDDFLIKWTNEKFARMFGYDLGELIGKCVDIIDATTEERTPIETRTSIADALRKTGEWHGEVKNIKRDGTHFWCYANVSLFDHPEYGKVEVSVNTDITKRKLAEEQLQQSFQRTKRAMDATIDTMSRIVEAKDPYTAGHQHQVSQLAIRIAQEMKLPEDKVNAIKTASLIHDIGKISLPTETLSKPTKLSDLEFTLIKGHSQMGYDILKSIDFSYPVAQIVLQHHERLNGSGYPQGLKGKDILLEARIIGVADVVEAMSSHRPYRPALGIDKALEEILKNRGILYDPEAADACLKLFKEKKFQFELNGVKGTILRTID